VKYQSATPEQKPNIAKFHNWEPLIFLEKDEVVEKFFHWLHDAGVVPQWNFESDGREYLNRHVKVIDGKIYPMIEMRMKPVSFTAAGKNFATFDKGFLEELPQWKTALRTKQRVIDPAILYVDWKNDEVLPDLATCKVRANLPNYVSHKAIEDAWDTLQTLRKFY
jgi:hypothetical protein